MSVHVLAHVQSVDGILPQLRDARRVTFTNLRTLPKWTERGPTAVKWFVKVLYQLVYLLWVMLTLTPAPTVMLVQSPPALPVLAVCAAVARWRRAKLVVDFHNLAFTLMRRGQRPPDAGFTKADVLPSDPLTVRIAAAYEKRASGCADAAVTVSRAFSEWLQQEWGVRASVLYDRAPASFGPVSPQQAHALLIKLRPDLLRPHHLGAAFLEREFVGDSTPLTALRDSAEWRAGARPALLVSSTSWTPDEDFGVLLEAAQRYEEACRADQADRHARLILVVTGRGPDKAAFLERLALMQFDHVALRTAWLAAEDYPRLLACADLGVSLHTSSSDLDLPMKVSDMLGSGTPVCAMRYRCAGEQVVDGRTGCLFSTASELAAVWLRLFARSPAGDRHPRGWGAELCELADGVRADRVTWEHNWSSVMAAAMHRS